MCQGRFDEAGSLAAQILGDAAPEDHTTRGDVHRMLHLAHRFAADYPAAHQALEDATEAYRAAGSVIGTLKLATNRAELLAWSGSPDAVEAAVAALESQEEFGDQAEIGKIYTALAIAQLRRANVPEAVAALHSADAALVKAHYRSGRARAELIRACTHAVAGDRHKVIACVASAVSELTAAEVYPTLVIFGETLLARIGTSHQDVAAAAATVRARISPSTQLPLIEHRTAAVIDQLIGSAA